MGALPTGNGIVEPGTLSDVARAFAAVRDIHDGSHSLFRICTAQHVPVRGKQYRELSFFLHTVTTRSMSEP
jgi:hypothetical protein